MKEWVEARKSMMESKDTEKLNKEITPRFQNEYFALKTTSKQYPVWYILLHAKYVLDWVLFFYFDDRIFMIHFQAQTLKQYCYKSDLWLILRRLVNQIHFQSGNSVNPQLFYVIPIIVDYFIFWYNERLNLAYVKLSPVVSVQL